MSAVPENLTTIKELTEQVLKFRNDRDWKQFHSMPQMLLGLFSEVAELSDLFQWKSDTEISTYLATNKSLVSDELADILYWVLLIAADLNINLSEAFNAKMQSNEAKYPVELVQGKNKKYNEY